MTAPLCVRELTARGMGGLSVLCVAGPGAHARLAARWPRIGRIAVGGLGLARLDHAGDTLDEALVAVVAEERVELGLHGSPAVVRAVVRALVAETEHFRAVLADDTELAPEAPEEAAPGSSGSLAGVARLPDGAALLREGEERARRALARATSEAEARILLDQAEGALGRELAALARASHAESAAGLVRLAARAREFELLAHPVIVVLAGPVNAGKSTLFNVLVGSERVVVSDAPGTTRDLVRERALFGAWPVDLVDTAGERELEGLGAALAVERAGQALGRELRATADLVLWLHPFEAGPAPAPAPIAAGPPVCVLVSRTPPELATDPQALCARLGQGSAGGAVAAIAARERPDAAADVCAALFRQSLGLSARPWRPGAGVPVDSAARAWIAALGRLTAEERARELARSVEGRSDAG